MAISRDLFLAILSMDSYNHGYNAGINDGGANDPDGLGGSGSQIGNATVLVDDVSPEAQAAGFYVVEYEWDGETIISYRGTDTIAEGFLVNYSLAGHDGVASDTRQTIPSCQGSRSRVSCTYVN